MVGSRTVALLAVAALASACQAKERSSDATVHAAVGQEKATGMENLFDRAVITTGSEYVEAERQLLQQVKNGSTEALDTIARGAQAPDPLAGLLADVLLAARSASGEDYDKLERLFRNLPERSARTPLGEPEPEGVQSILTRAYGARATKFLALRLAKQVDWPDWQVYGVLLYLAAHKDPATTPAVLRFAIVTAIPERVGWARDTLQAIADPAFAVKLAQAVRWAEARDLPVPLELRLVGSVK